VELMGMDCYTNAFFFVGVLTSLLVWHRQDMGGITGNFLRTRTAGGRLRRSSRYVGQSHNAQARCMAAPSRNNSLYFMTIVFYYVQPYNYWASRYNRIQSPLGICAGQRQAESGFSPRIEVSLVNYHSTDAWCSYSFYQRRYGIDTESVAK
jgi:hypothetical protein